MRLDGRTALSTSGAMGIGLTTAKPFVADGARVAVTGRDASELDRAPAATSASTP